MMATSPISSLNLYTYGPYFGSSKTSQSGDLHLTFTSFTAMTDVNEVSEGIAAGRLGVAMMAVVVMNISGERNRDLTRYFWIQIVVGATQGKI